MSEITKYSDGRLSKCKPWQGGVFYIFWSEGRRSRRQSTGTKSISEAQEYLDEFVRLNGTISEPKRLVCRDLFAMKYPDPSERQRIAWDKHLDPVFGDMRPRDITNDVERIYIRDRGAQGAAPSTIRFELSILRASWNYAASPQQKILSSDDLPALGPLPKPSPPRDRWLRDDEVQKVIDAAQEYGQRTWLFVWLAIETAARRSAIQDLTWAQVDWDTGVIHYLPEGAEQTRKRKASVPISDALRPVLEKAYRSRSDEYVIGAGSRVNAAVSNIARKAGVRGVTPHVFRHTAATRMARRGVPLWLIAKVLGNTIEQVEKVYAKHSPEMLVDAVNMISGGQKAAHNAQNARPTDLQYPTTTNIWDPADAVK